MKKKIVGLMILTSMFSVNYLYARDQDDHTFSHHYKNDSLGCLMFTEYSKSNGHDRGRDKFDEWLKPGETATWNLACTYAPKASHAGCEVDYEMAVAFRYYNSETHICEEPRKMVDYNGKLVDAHSSKARRVPAREIVKYHYYSPNNDRSRQDSDRQYYIDHITSVEDQLGHEAVDWSMGSYDDAGAWLVSTGLWNLSIFGGPWN